MRRSRRVAEIKASRSEEVVGCDHTSTKAPTPIRTPKLSVLGESSTNMGDLLGSPRVASLFLIFLLHRLKVPLANGS